MKMILAIAGAFLAITCATVPAHAETQTMAHVAVPYADLNLGTNDGADAMLNRIQRAATRACGGRPETGPLMLVQRQAFNECRAQAISETVIDLNAPLVTALRANA